jgi:hypothetical protein
MKLLIMQFNTCLMGSLLYQHPDYIGSMIGRLLNMEQLAYGILAVGAEVLGKKLASVPHLPTTNPR